MKSIAFALLAAAWCTAAVSASPADVAAEAVRITPIKGVSRVEITKSTPTAFTYFVWYKPGEGSVQRAKTDTVKLVRATLAALVKYGKNPSEDWVRIHAHGAEEVRGETGKKLAAELGDAHYNFNLDTVEFSPPKRQ